MAYATTNPPNLVTAGSLSGPQVWIYVSADAHGDVDAADYFSNGDDLGLTVNDVMIVVDTNVGTCTIHYVTTVTSGGAATIAAATLA